MIVQGVSVMLEMNLSTYLHWEGGVAAFQMQRYKSLVFEAEALEVTCLYILWISGRRFLYHVRRSRLRVFNKLNEETLRVCPPGRVCSKAGAWSSGTGEPQHYLIAKHICPTLGMNRG